jgi:hypothetical protein
MKVTCAKSPFKKCCLLRFPLFQLALSSVIWNLLIIGNTARPSVETYHLFPFFLPLVAVFLRAETAIQLKLNLKGFLGTARSFDLIKTDKPFYKSHHVHHILPP